MKIHPQLVAFFQKHNLYDERMFRYFEEHSTMLDGDNMDERMLRACAYLVNERTGILEGIHINIPYVKDERTMLDSVHELTHAIFTYPKIGKKFKKDITIEALPLLYEKLYVLENPSPKLLKYKEELDSFIGDEAAYQFGYKICDELIEKYDNNPKKASKMVKKLARKYH